MILPSPVCCVGAICLMRLPAGPARVGRATQEISGAAQGLRSGLSQPASAPDAGSELPSQVQHPPLERTRPGYLSAAKLGLAGVPPTSATGSAGLPISRCRPRLNSHTRTDQRRLSLDTAAFKLPGDGLPDERRGASPRRS